MTQQREQLTTTATYDKQARVGYMHLTPNKKEAGLSDKTIQVEGNSIVLDFNEYDELVGIEFLNPEQLPPIIKDAVEIE